MPLNTADPQNGAGERTSPGVDERARDSTTIPRAGARRIRTAAEYPCGVVSQPRELDVGDVSPALEVREIRVGHRAVLAVSGELDLATADTLQTAVDAAIASGAAEIWVDLSHVAFMDSTGLRVLLRAQALLRARSKSFAVICPPGPVRRVFEVSGLDRSLAIHPDRAAAHAAG